MNFEERFASNIKALRKKHNMTQKALAEAVGCSEKAVSKWECAQSLPDIEVLFAISKSLKTNVESLFAESGRPYLLGIDGGGTKTHLALADEDGNILREHITDCSNPIDIGLEKACDILRNGIYEICRDIPFSSVACFAGIAGGTSGGMQEALANFFAEFDFLAAKADTDNANIISAGLRDDDGITLILGTGVCSFLQKGGVHSKIAGNGFFIDDGGSAFDIGREALVAYYREKDGYGMKTEITRLISETGFDEPQQLLHHIYSEGKKFIASFAHYAYDAARIGDETAHGIISRNMKNAARFVLANANKLALKKIPLVLAGGLTNEPLTLSYLREALGTAYDFDIKILDRAPAYGAVLLAKKLLNAKEEGK